MEELLRQLNRRVERLNEWFKVNAPILIIKNEISLIEKSCDEIAKQLEENNK